MDAVYSAVALVLVALTSGTVTWRVSSRAKSGEIDTSEAEKLWDEGTAMRLELRAEVAALKAQLITATEAVSALNVEIRLSRAETAVARRETEKSREGIRQLMKQIDALSHEVTTNNTLTLGQLGDNAETRRILEIPKEVRSLVEQQHLQTANERQPQSDRPVVPEADRGGSS